MLKKILHYINGGVINLFKLLFKEFPLSLKG